MKLSESQGSYDKTTQQELHKIEPRLGSCCLTQVLNCAEVIRQSKVTDESEYRRN